jgi:hypothetical protein
VHLAISTGDGVVLALDHLALFSHGNDPTNRVGQIQGGSGASPVVDPELSFYVEPMFPTLSVTAIGLIVGGLELALTRDGWAALLAGVVGAWVGFGLGAVIGVVFDVVVGTGTGVALAGHALAIVGAMAAVRSRTWEKAGPKSS